MIAIRRPLTLTLYFRLGYGLPAAAGAFPGAHGFFPGAHGFFPADHGFLRAADAFLFERPLELGKPALEELEAAANLARRLLPAAGELHPGLLPAASELVARSPAPANDLVDELRSAFARLGRRACRRLHRSLDRRAQRVGEPALGRPVGALRVVEGLVIGSGHPTAQHNPRTLTTYLRPTAEIAADAIVVGNPRTAMLFAQELTEGAVMANHTYGLWGYTGRVGGEHPLSFQSTGIGGAAAALVIAELAVLGSKRVISVREVTGAGGGPVVVSTALPLDGTSAALGSGAGPVASDEALMAALLAAGGERLRPAPVVSVDPGGEAAGEERALDAGAFAVDYETAALLTASRRAGIAAGALLAAAPPAGAPSHEDLDDGVLNEELLELGRIATAALLA